jgi:hypothetical protein
VTFSFNPDGVARVLVLNVADEVALASSRVTRPLTVQECQRFLHLTT